MQEGVLAAEVVLLAGPEAVDVHGLVDLCLQMLQDNHEDGGLHGDGGADLLEAVAAGLLLGLDPLVFGQGTGADLNFAEILPEPFMKHSRRRLSAIAHHVPLT